MPFSTALAYLNDNYCNLLQILLQITAVFRTFVKRKRNKTWLLPCYHSM